jgi:hypothetical protein
VADPYATRHPDLSDRPEGPPPWADEIARRGGSVVGPGGELDDGCAFAVIPCRGIGTLAPLARLDPPLAVLLWLEHAAAPRDGEAANALLAALAGLDRPVLAIKQGLVGGPPERAGCAAVSPELIAAVLDGLGDIAWERDPDFGYEVPGSVPGLPEPDARILEPRLLYADNDRVYEHADLVADKQRERHAIAAAVPGLDPGVAGASGWPPVPTGAEWGG